MLQNHSRASVVAAMEPKGPLRCAQGRLFDGSG